MKTHLKERRHGRLITEPDTGQLRCVTCRKVAYPHREAASKAAKSYPNQEPYHTPVCGWWHLRTIRGTNR